MKSFWITMLVTALYCGSFACTAVCLKDGNKTYMCKNFDYTEINGLLVCTPAGTPYFSARSDLEWVSLYTNVTICYGERNRPLGGMNECGLVIEELSCPPYNIRPESGTMHLNEFQWVKYHLDNCATVNEVVQMQDEISLVPEEFFVHYIVADHMGNIAVVEFQDGKAKVYKDGTLPFHVLSNNTYEESCRYHSKFTGFCGKMPLVSSSASCDRFAWVAEKSRTIDTTAISVEICYDLLDEVKQVDTQFQLVYDIVNRKLYFLRNGSTLRHCIDLNSFLYGEFTEILAIPLMKK